MEVDGGGDVDAWQVFGGDVVEKTAAAFDGRGAGIGGGGEEEFT